jgi:dephospho-CoA kinase
MTMHDAVNHVVNDAARKIGAYTNALVIGLTGNIATGKSTVLEFFARLGAFIIDADKLSHHSFAPDGPAYAAVVKEFGQSILQEDGTVNRRALGEIVFSDANLLKKLEMIVHPAVFEMVRELVSRAPSPLVILEAVKLLEAGTMASQCDEVWVVTARPEVQLRRLMEERGMDEDAARRRMAMQSPQAAKVNQADRVIENSGTLEELYAQLERIWVDLKVKYPKRMAQLVGVSS